VYFEPKYLLARRMVTKVIALTAIFDDIYDTYGTLEEIELFTEAIERLKLTHFLILAIFLISRIPMLYISINCFTLIAWTQMM
jgi:hypothetical protein